MALNVIQLEGVSKRFGKTHAVENISLAVESGELFALLGASGCGKTTTLRLIAGLETPDAGEIWLEGMQVAGGGCWVPPEGRALGMVFQDYALFPHLTVEANISFPLKRWRGKERQVRLAELLALVGLQAVAKRFPHQLSGGQQQRVALARALAVQPPIVLLDEPFSNLDAALRKSTRAEVRHILKASHTSAVFVTHDQEEALSIADRIGVMYGGALLQVGTPQEVYLRPIDRTVAAFIGEANFIPAEGAGDVADCILGRLPLLQPAHGPLDLLLRPESLRLRPAPDGLARIETLQFLGSDQALGLRLPDDNLIHARARAHETLRLGERVALETVEACVAFPRADRASPAPEGT